MSDLQFLGVHIQQDDQFPQKRGGESIAVLRLAMPSGRLREIELDRAALAKLLAEAAHVNRLLARLNP